MSLLPFGWIRWLIEVGVHNPPIFWIVFVSLSCLGLVGAGVVYDRQERDGAAGFWTAFIATIVSGFWPWIAIAAPFILLASSLFFGGVYVSQQLKKALLGKALPSKGLS